ncbi:MAG: dienelactone hydrolase family protein [Woeseiaceae bacterium]
MALQSRFIDYQHGDITLQAEMCWDDSVSGKRPGILIAPNWAGRSPQDGKVARKLAEQGYVGFALDMYGKGILGTSVEENTANMQPLMQDRAKLQQRLTCALDTLSEQPEVDTTRVAIIGYCFGGLCALDMARAGHAIVGAVSFHGLFAKPDNLSPSNIDAKVLILHGWDDPMALPDSVLGVAAELTDAGADWQLHAYGNTMHAFTAPAANDPEHGTVYSASADRRSWQSMLNFLDELFTD